MMTIEKRRELVFKILQGAANQAGQEAERILSATILTKEFVYEHFRRYLLAKLLLDENQEAEELSALLKESLRRTMKFDPAVLKNLETALPCDNVTNLSAKRVLLLYTVKKEFGLQIDAETLIQKKTVKDLADVILKEQQKMYKQNDNQKTGSPKGQTGSRSGGNYGT